MFGKRVSSVLVAGLLGVIGVTAGPVGHPVYRGPGAAFRTLELNEASSNSCSTTVPPPDPHKRAVDLGKRAPTVGCHYFPCGGYNVQLRGKIGQGGYGVVYRGVAVGVDGRPFDVAIKTCAAGSACVHGAHVQKQLSSNHAGFGRVYDFCQIEHTFYSIQEFLSGGDMFAAINNRIYEGNPGRVFRDYGKLLDAAIYMSSQGWAHRDLKPENVMLDGRGGVKIIDLDMATKSPTSVRVCGTVLYEGPEQSLHHPYSPKINDNWALGVILFEMLKGQRPFYNALSPTATAVLQAGHPRDGAKVLQQKFPDLPRPFALLFAQIFAYQSDRLSKGAIKHILGKIERVTIHPQGRVGPAERTFAVDEGEFPVEENLG